MQLVAYGAQDVYLTGNPQITFFKVVYRRHTNFAVEQIEVTFNGSPDFGKTVTCPIQRNGDLVTKIYLRVELGSLDAGSGNKVAWTPFLGHALVDYVELDIGGSQIDKHYGDWLNIWYELARDGFQDDGYNKMIGNTEDLTTLAQTHDAAILHVPLQFFHCRNDGLALPLIALQYHDVQIKFSFRRASECLITQGTPTTTDAGAHFDDAFLLVDYIFLDTEERKRFAQASHEYLIEQLQFTGDESVTSNSMKYRLNYNHPCKALFWAVRLGRYTDGNSFLAYDGVNPEAARDIATKRFILKVSDRTATSGGTSRSDTGAYVFLDTTTKVIEFRTVTGVTSTALTGLGTCRLIDDEDNKVTTTDTMTLDNIIYDTPLPWYYVSLPSATLYAGWAAFTGEATSAVVGDEDVTVYVHNNYGLHLDNTINPVATGLIQLNGHDRFQVRDGDFFNYVQPYECFKHTPRDGVNTYSFALKPVEHQPSGSCNMSRIDNALLNLTFSIPAAETALGWTFSGNYLGDTTKMSIYAMNYNVLRIMSGMGGLAYSN